MFSVGKQFNPDSAQWTDLMTRVLQNITTAQNKYMMTTDYFSFSGSIKWHSNFLKSLTLKSSTAAVTIVHHQP